MAVFLVKFVLCSGLLLLTYHLLLKNKTTYQFNRVYLLLSLVFSLAIPFIAVERPASSLMPMQPVIEQIKMSPADDATSAETTINQPAAAMSDIVEQSPVRTNYVVYFIAGLYGLVTLALFGRFIKNVIVINSSAKNNERLPYRDAWLVLIDQNLTPHTFLNYIFISGDEYVNGRIEGDVLRHELAHARELHSADVLFVELLHVICWFNPFIYLYRKAIQLNHEFIAVVSVINNGGNIIAYQHLLFEKVAGASAITIASQFNYSVTKKRLIMMTKNTSAKMAMLSRLAVIPVLGAAFMLFCTIF